MKGKKYIKKLIDKYEYAISNPRKQMPMFSGLIKYFPKALREISKTSFISNEQHNPQEQLHWAREKSNDHLDALVRHLTDYAEGNKIDEDRTYHLAKVAWRAMAQLELDLEE